MTSTEQFPYCDRNPATGAVDLLPDSPITLHYQNNSVSGIGLVDSGAAIGSESWTQSTAKAPGSAANATAW